MYEFYKYKGELIEGYLGEPENFNGIIFLLKEPNNPDGAKEFWFKNMLLSEERYLNSERKSKAVFSKFKNRFSEMIECTNTKKELKDAIFCNVNPLKGKATVTQEFFEVLKSGKVEKMLYFFADLKDDITLFTCSDVYSYLFKSDKLPNKTKKSGLSFKNKPLGCFTSEIGNTKITVYEIYHPSRSGKILNKNNADIP